MRATIIELMASFMEQLVFNRSVDITSKRCKMACADIFHLLNEFFQESNGLKNQILSPVLFNFLSTFSSL